MADEQNMDGAVDGAEETASSSGANQATETTTVGQEFSSPIPGFPPFFQFAKLQTEASSWSSNASTSASFTSCSDANMPDKTACVVDTGVSYEHSVSSESNNAVESSPVNGMEILLSMDEKSANVPELQDGEKEEDEQDKDEDGVINDEPDEELAESDPYFYTKRDEFTSEIYKIELQNLPKKCGYKVSYILHDFNNISKTISYMLWIWVILLPTTYM